MADTKFYLTSCIAKRYASLEIACGRCGHKIVADGPKISEMFPRPISLEIAPHRLRCKACGKRTPRLTVIRKPPR